MANLLRLQLTGDTATRPAHRVRIQEHEYGLLCANGQGDWYSDCPMVAPTMEVPAPAWPERFARRLSVRRRLMRVSPSSRAEGPRPAHLLFATAVNRSLDLGTAVHGMFEQVEWSDHTTADAAIARWRARQVDGDPEAEAHFRQALEASAFQEALAQPGAGAVCWRERMFEAVIDREWVTGTFDRVVIERDGDGTVTRAFIQDFKTNVISEGEEERTVDHYRPQLALYAQALAKLIGCPAERIVCQLLFTRSQRVVTVA